MKPLTWAVLVLAVMVFGVGTVGVTWYLAENAPVDEGNPVEFRIEPGSSLSVTARRLQEVGLLRSAFLFKIIHQVKGTTHSIPSGTFLVPRGLTALQVSEWFADATPIEVRVTIPEGLTSRKIARILEDKQVAVAAEVLDLVTSRHLDGQLFPDTYQFGLHAGAEAAVTKMTETFNLRTAELRTGLSADEVARNVIMASIVEREYRVPKEASVIGSVFWNRLEKGIPLASCATIEYILTEVQGRPHPKRIFFVHTQISSPYNTYLNKGLPPAPICNPGLTALKAAFQPSNTPYLYFVVADPVAGSHSFSQNYSDHERARELYLNTYVSKS